MPIHAPGNRLISLWLCRRHYNDRKEEKPETNVGQVEEKRLVFLGCTQRECKTHKDRGGESKCLNPYSQQARSNHCWAWERTPERHHFVVPRHGRTREEMGRKILRIVKTEGSGDCTKCPLPVLMTINFFWGQTRDSWRIIGSMLEDFTGMP